MAIMAGTLNTSYALFYPVTNLAPNTERKQGPREIGIAHGFRPYEMPVQQTSVIADDFFVKLIERKSGPRDVGRPEGWRPPPEEWKNIDSSFWSPGQPRISTTNKGLIDDMSINNKSNNSNNKRRRGLVRTSSDTKITMIRSKLKEREQVKKTKLYS
eukprot:UN23720